MKLWKLTTDIGSEYVGGITKTFTPRLDPYGHSLWHYDKYFVRDGSLS
jgi:hypothetical protein